MPKGKEKKLAQLNLVGTIISTQDERIRFALDNVRSKTTLKRFWPGAAFEVGISPKDRDIIDGITDPQKRRNYVVKKMRLISGTEMAVKREGLVYQEDLEMFVKLLFETKAAHMSPEAYEEFMKDQKKEKTEDLKKVAKKVKDKQAQEQEEEKEEEQAGILQAESEMVPA